MESSGLTPLEIREIFLPGYMADLDQVDINLVNEFIFVSNSIELFVLASSELSRSGTSALNHVSCSNDYELSEGISSAILMMISIMYSLNFAAELMDTVWRVSFVLLLIDSGRY